MEYDSDVELQALVKPSDYDHGLKPSPVRDPALERRVKWKTDLIILPLLVSILFLAQMVSDNPQS
jgi:hypothetical protein